MDMSFEIAKIVFVQKRDGEDNTIKVKNPNANGLGQGVAGLNTGALNQASSLGDIHANGLMNSKIGSGDKEFEVQFNPRELRFSGLGADREAITTRAKKEDGNSERKKAKEGLKAKIEIDIPLVFDAVNPSDAFMFAYSQLTLYSAKNLAQKGLGKKELTVQPVVEGFIGALRNPKTRTIRFIWGDMMYEGNLNQINSTYTMFSTSGKPIRAIVNLRMLTTADAGQIGQWQQKYQKYFQGDSSSHTQIGQAASSFLNL